jgi:hypothetical protein
MRTRLEVDIMLSQLHYGKYINTMGRDDHDARVMELTYFLSKLLGEGEVSLTFAYPPIGDTL